MHVVVVDDLGTITGSQGTILEKHVFPKQKMLSLLSILQKTFYKTYLADFSEQIYAGGNPGETADAHFGTTPRATGFSEDFAPISTADGVWGLEAQGVTYNAVGNVTYPLKGGVDYSAAGGMKAELGDLITSYGEFDNKDEIEVDYLIMGPGCINQSESRYTIPNFNCRAKKRLCCNSWTTQI